MLMLKCKNKCCSVRFCPLELLPGITFHTFQGLSPGVTVNGLSPVPVSRIFAPQAPQSGQLVTAVYISDSVANRRHTLNQNDRQERETTWVINVKLPNGTYCRVYCNSRTPAHDLYSSVSHAASTSLSLKSCDLYSLFNGCYFAKTMAPVHAIGMYDMCTVEVFISLKGGVFVTTGKTDREQTVSLRGN